MQWACGVLKFIMDIRNFSIFRSSLHLIRKTNDDKHWVFFLIPSILRWGNQLSSRPSSEWNITFGQDQCISLLSTDFKTISLEKKTKLNDGLRTRRTKNHRDDGFENLTHLMTYKVEDTIWIYRLIYE